MKTPYNNNKNVNKPRVEKRADPEYGQCEYSYYSRLLNKPFDSLTELKEAEATYYAELRAKEDRAAAKKADAAKVEVAFKAMNQARRDYKDNILKLTDLYQQELKTLKANFENEKSRIQSALVDAENTYSSTLKAFTDKYPEGYHLTLKDGDYETSISSTSSDKATDNTQDTLKNLKEIFDIIFGI